MRVLGVGGGGRAWGSKNGHHGTIAGLHLTSHDAETVDFNRCIGIHPQSISQTTEVT
jgi:hypothetical protein